MTDLLFEGVFKKRGKLFTKNLLDKKDFRHWNPYKSKLSTAILKGLKKITIKPDSHVLYLGAATGTTVSHVSDIAENGVVYAVENAPVSMKKLLVLCRERSNIVPISEDAFHPDRYSMIVPSVDIVYQDISQRNQSDIFIKNINRYLKKEGFGLIMVKARSVDVSLKPKQVYENVCEELEKNDLKVIDVVDLSPFEKDHAAILSSF